MEIRVRSKLNQANDYLINVQPYEGGILSAIEVPVGSGVWCPIVVYDDAVSIGLDKLEVQTPKVVSDLFWAYDTIFVADTRINPTLTGPGAIPVLALSASETTRTYTTANLPSSTATYKIALVNPNNYKVQFCTNVEGTGGTLGGTTGGFPANDTTAWVNIETTGGFYLVRSFCSDTHDQTIYIRYERSGGGYSADFRIAPNLPRLPIYKEGIEIIVGGSGNVVASKGFGLVWGNFGEDPPSDQGTQEEERYMLSQAAFKNQAPFYAVEHAPTNITVNTFNFATGAGDGGTAIRSVTVNYLLTDTVMDKVIEYLVRSGLNGFGILHYADDATLGRFRMMFRAMSSTRRRGAKAFHIIYNQGGTSGSVYQASITNMATDINHADGWYFKVEKGGNQVPVLMALIDADPGNTTAVTAQVAERLTALNAVKSAANIGTSYNVLMTTGADISSYIGGSDWDAQTNYYTYGDYSKGFIDTYRILSEAMETNRSNKRLVPMISCGLDQRARFFMKKNTTDIGLYNYTDDVLPKLGNMIELVKHYLDGGACKLWMGGIVDENTEQGKGLFPTIRISDSDNRIDDRAIMIFHDKLNPTYTIPV